MNENQQAIPVSRFIPFLDAVIVKEKEKKVIPPQQPKLTIFPFKDHFRLNKEAMELLNPIGGKVLLFDAGKDSTPRFFISSGYNHPLAKGKGRVIGEKVSAKGYFKYENVWNKLLYWGCVKTSNIFASIGDLELIQIGYTKYDVVDEVQTTNIVTDLNVSFTVIPAYLNSDDEINTNQEGEILYGEIGKYGDISIKQQLFALELNN